MSKKNKEIKAQEKAKQKAKDDSQHVKMRFKEDKFYNDLSNPKYRAGVVYDIVGADQIQRWLKRGGEIVSGDFSAPEAVDNTSTLAKNPHSEQNPYSGSKEEPKSEEPAFVDTGETASDSEENQEDEEI